MNLKKADEGTRPTSGKVREAVMNSIQMRLAQARFLDAYAGSGGVGIDALSRGAESATFIEVGKEALACLRQNIKEVERRAGNVGKKIGIRIEARSVKDVLPKEKDQAYDLLWFDPPYANLPTDWQAFEKELSRIASEDAMLIVESDEAGASYLAGWADGDRAEWDLVNQKVYGIIHVNYFKRKEFDETRGNV